MSVICTRHPGATVAHQHDTTCPLCVAIYGVPSDSEVQTLANTAVALAERKVKICERRIRELEAAISAHRIPPPPTPAQGPDACGQIPLLQGVA